MKQKSYSDVEDYLWNHLHKKVKLRHQEAPLFLRVTFKTLDELSTKMF